MVFGNKKKVVEVEKKKIYFVVLYFEGNNSVTLEYFNEEARNDIINRIRKSIFEGKELEVGDISNEVFTLIHTKKIIYYKKGVTER